MTCGQQATSWVSHTEHRLLMWFCYWYYRTQSCDGEDRAIVVRCTEAGTTSDHLFSKGTNHSLQDLRARRTIEKRHAGLMRVLAEIHHTLYLRVVRLWTITERL